jgi:hypothetical protein
MVNYLVKSYGLGRLGIGMDEVDELEKKIRDELEKKIRDTLNKYTFDVDFMCGLIQGAPKPTGKKYFVVPKEVKPKIDDLQAIDYELQKDKE